MSRLLSSLPNMNDLISHPLLKSIGRERVKHAARETLEKLRNDAQSGAIGKLPDLDMCAQMVQERITRDGGNLRGLINATGIVLHTNLGRAPLGAYVYNEAAEVCSGYSNLEYDIETGKRGSRYAHIEEHIRALTGAEAAMVVNNNAAAMVLSLAALASGKNVAISRGELVEIGGSFRIPEIIATSGATLVEVGTTNKTRLSDYIDAVENKGAEVLLKVHTSNFEIIGFTENVSVTELSEYGRSAGLPVLYDMGSCFMVQPGHFGINSGETAMGGVADGADVICFSGDKLLGSVQAGIIAGRLDLVAKMKKHPLARALRPDKLTLCFLEAALKLCRYPDEAVKHIPALAMLFADPEQLHHRAESLAVRLKESLNGWSVEVCETNDEAGGGSLPNVPFPGWAVAIKPQGMSVNELEERLRLGSTPIIIRIQDDAALISPRTLMPSDEDILVDALSHLGGHGGHQLYHSGG